MVNSYTNTLNQLKKQTSKPFKMSKIKLTQQTRKGGRKTEREKPVKNNSTKKKVIVGNLFQIGNC